MATSYPHQYGRTGHGAPTQAAHANYFKESLARRPFTNTANHQSNVRNAALGNKELPPKPVEEIVEQKQAASPPLPRQNTKTAPPSPPRLIVDNSNTHVYKRERLLGEVRGFSRTRSFFKRINREASRVYTK